MNGKKARALRRMTREEVSRDQTKFEERELVLQRFRGHDRVINNPFTIRGFGKQVKKAYLNQQRKSA